MKKILLTLLLFWPALALAQSAPNFYQNFVPSAAQSQSYFAGKMDYPNHSPVSLSTVTGTLPLANGGLGGSQAAATAGQVPVFPGTGGAAVPTNVLGGVINPMLPPYNAKCDGSTDDSAAFQSALNAIGASSIGALFIPPTGVGCVIGTTLSSSHGRLFIYGAGGGSKLIITASGGGINFTGSCGLTYEEVYMQDFSFVSDNAGNPAFAVELNGVAAYGLFDVSIDASIAGRFVKGVSLLGAQQGYVKGGYDEGSETGIYLNDCGSSIGSNGVDISSRTFVSSVAAVDIEGHSSDVWVRNNHITSSATGIIANASTAPGVSYIEKVHLEVNTTYGIDIQSGVVIASGINDYNTNSVKVHSGAQLQIHSGQFNGTIVYDAGSYGVIANNYLDGPATINATAGNVLQYGNFGNGNPTIPTYWQNNISVGAPNDLTSSAADITVNGTSGAPGAYVNINAYSGAFGQARFYVSGSYVGGTIYSASYGSAVTNNLPYQISFNGGATFPVVFGTGGQLTTADYLSTAVAVFNTSNAPSLTSCGTTTPSVSAGSSNQGGQFTTGGTTGTACTVTFANAYPNYAFCTISNAFSTC